MHALPEDKIQPRQPPPPLPEMRLCRVRPLFREEVPATQSVVQTGAGVRVLLQAALHGRHPPGPLRLLQPFRVFQQQYLRR